MWSVLLSGLEQILYERIDLLRTELRLEVLRHCVRRETGRDDGVRGDDRLPDVGRALGRDVDLVEVRADRTGRAGVGERVAGAATALAREDRLAQRGGRGRAVALSRWDRAELRVRPLLEGRRGEYVG